MGGTSMYREQLGEDFPTTVDKKYKNKNIKTHFATFSGTPLCNATHTTILTQGKNLVTCKRCLSVMQSRGLIKPVLRLKKPVNL